MANLAARGVPKKPECNAQVGDRGRPSPFRKDFCVNGHDLAVTRRRYGKAKKAICGQCQLDAQRRCRAKKPQQYRENIVAARRRRQYGITPVAYAEMLIAQEGKCAICKFPGEQRGKYALAVDHDHKTGKVRGLLCGRCNTALGSLEESVDALRSMIEYVLSRT